MSSKTNSSLHKKKAHLDQLKPNYYLIPFIFAISAIPLIVFCYEYQNGLTNQPWFTNEPKTQDFFLYYKSFFFIIASAIMLAIVAIRMLAAKKRMKWAPAFIPLGAYAFLAVLSSVVSEYRYFSAHGVFEQFESVFVLLGYCMLAYYGFLFVQNEHDIKIVLRWLNVSIIIMLIIGLSQAFSHDIYESKLGKYLILSASDREVGTLDFVFDPGRVYLSLYNPNYVGSYVALLAPIFIALVFFGRKIKMSIFNAVILLCLILCLFGAQARSGIVGIAISLIVLIILFRRQIVKRWQYAAAGIGVILIAFFIMNHLTDNILYERIKSIFNPVKTASALEEIQTNDDNITVKYNGSTLVLGYETVEDSARFTFLDGTGAQVAVDYLPDYTGLVVQDERFPGFTIAPVALPAPDDQVYEGLSVTIDGQPWYFTNNIDGTYYLYTPTGKYDKINHPDTAFFKGYETFASNRGYIWSRTIPLLKKHFFLGSGADTFVFAFPNDDYVGKTNHGYRNQLITKPHNLYLQVGVQTGTLSLIALLVFYAIYFIDSIRLYWKNPFDNLLTQAGVGIFAGTIGYMVVAFINDSTVTVAPIFWGLIGIGIGINRRNLTKSKEKKSGN